jgi:tRNA (guanine-N(7)-)-methyltransferase subunit TRM82
MLKLWDWMNGKVKAEVGIWDTVQRFIKVRAVKKGRFGGEENKNKRKRGKGKGKEIEEGDADRESGDVLDPDTKPTADEQLQTESAADRDSGELVQVVHKIDSFEMGASRYILFSAVGCVNSVFLLFAFALTTDILFGSATAIFSAPFPSDTVTPSESSPPGSDADSIRHFDFGRPVLDFVVIRPDNGVVYVLLDGEWDGAGVEAGSSSSNKTRSGRMVRVVRWDSDVDEVRVSSFFVMMKAWN